MPVESAGAWRRHIRQHYYLLGTGLPSDGDQNSHMLGLGIGEITKERRMEGKQGAAAGNG